MDRSFELSFAVVLEYSAHQHGKASWLRIRAIVTFLCIGLGLYRRQLCPCLKFHYKGSISLMGIPLMLHWLSSSPLAGEEAGGGKGLRDLMTMRCTAAPSGCRSLY
jgi:hypothetical protein